MAISFWKGYGTHPHDSNGQNYTPFFTYSYEVIHYVLYKLVRSFTPCALGFFAQEDSEQ